MVMDVLSTRIRRKVIDIMFTAWVLAQPPWVFWTDRWANWSVNDPSSWLHVLQSNLLIIEKVQAVTFFHSCFILAWWWEGGTTLPNQSDSLWYQEHKAVMSLLPRGLILQSQSRQRGSIPSMPEHNYIFLFFVASISSLTLPEPSAPFIRLDQASFFKWVFFPSSAGFLMLWWTVVTATA